RTGPAQLEELSGVHVGVHRGGVGRRVNAEVRMQKSERKTESSSVLTSAFSLLRWGGYFPDTRSRAALTARRMSGSGSSRAFCRAARTPRTSLASSFVNCPSAVAVAIRTRGLGSVRFVARAGNAGVALGPMA